MRGLRAAAASTPPSFPSTAPHASDSVVKTLLARIAAVEGKLGGVDAAAAKRPLIEDRFVF